VISQIWELGECKDLQLSTLRVITWVFTWVNSQVNTQKVLPEKIYQNLKLKYPGYLMFGYSPKVFMRSLVTADTVIVSAI